MDPFTLASVAGAVTSLIPALKKGVSGGASAIIDAIWTAFFNALDIPPDKMNEVRNLMFGNLATAVVVCTHIIEDWMRDADRGDATAWQIYDFCLKAGMSIMQASKVRMMWYYLWGNSGQAQNTDYYRFTHDEKLLGALAGLTQPEKDSIIQYYALNAVGRVGWLEACPVSKWTPKFKAGMNAAGKALGQPSPGGGGGSSTTTGGDRAPSSGAAVPIAIAAIAALAAARGR